MTPWPISGKPRAAEAGRPLRVPVRIRQPLVPLPVPGGRAAASLFLHRESCAAMPRPPGPAPRAGAEPGGYEMVPRTSAYTSSALPPAAPRCGGRICRRRAMPISVGWASEPSCLERQPIGLSLRYAELPSSRRRPTGPQQGLSSAGIATGTYGMMSRRRETGIAMRRRASTRRTWRFSSD